MHKELLNAARLKILIIPQGPLIVKAGGMDIKKPTDMQWVRTHHPRTGKETIYIPGSSLKGVLRSYAERLLRSRGLVDKKLVPCDPTAQKEEEKETRGEKTSGLRLSCGKRLEKQKGPTLYREACATCRVFGNTKLRGRLGVSDAYPVDPEAVKIETRYGVAISRTKQSVAHGPFDMEVAVSGKFEAKVTLLNYELWQLGLLATCLAAMNDGWLTVGFGKNRGFGHVKAVVNELVIEQVGKDAQKLKGVAAIKKDLIDTYGLREKTETAAEHEYSDSEKTAESSKTPIGMKLIWRDKAAWKVLQDTANRLDVLWGEG